MSIINCDSILSDQVIDGSHVVRAVLSSVSRVGEDEGGGFKCVGFCSI